MTAHVHKLYGQPQPHTLNVDLEELGLETAPPIWAGREARDGEPTLYVCRGRTCSPPTHDVETALEWLDGDDGGDAPI